MNILVLGASGMIGSCIYGYLQSQNHSMIGTYYSQSRIKDKIVDTNIVKLDCKNFDETLNLISKCNVDVIINCIGITKHTLSNINDNIIFKLNSDLPNFLAKYCLEEKKKLIQISTDCVYDGSNGNYSEHDHPNAKDIYGISKARGEINDNHNVTLRTSTIGHELFTKNGLLEWFLDQDDQVNGFSNAIFNGLTTNYLARLINEFAIHDNMYGLYNISSDKISKYHLLKIINKVYNKKVKIIKDESFIINRSLNSSKFYKFSNFKFPNWEKMINDMFIVNNV